MAGIAGIVGAAALASACGSRALDGGASGRGGASGNAGSTATGTAGATGGTGAGGGSAGAIGHDECHTDADCPAGVCSGPPCSESLCGFGPDGFHHCYARTPPSLLACPTPSASAFPCCASDADCADQPGGHCIPYTFQYCGGPAPLQGNRCVYDACTSDADCAAQPNGFCTVGYPRTCLYGPCRSDADCTAGPGGQCMLGSSTSYCPYSVVFCRYANDPCRSSADCPQDAGAFGAACTPNTDLQGASCHAISPPPV